MRGSQPDEDKGTAHGSVFPIRFVPLNTRAGCSHHCNRRSGRTVSPTACDDTNLPMGIWTLIRFDDAGEPCATHASQLGGSCTPNTWNWIVEGNFAFTTAPGYKKVRVRVQVWAGGGGGACTEAPAIRCSATIKPISG